jgi:Invasion associated locus B (IalB) protein
MSLPYRPAIITAVLLASLAGQASAQEVKVLGTFGKWVAQTYKENGKSVCFMSVKPESSEGNYKARGEVQFLVTNRPATQAFDVISVVAGYQYLPDSDAVIVVNGKRFALFTNGERAWARDSKTDKDVVVLLMKGKSFTVKGTSSRNNVTTDVFPLAGFSAAHQSIIDACKK